MSGYLSPKVWFYNASRERIYDNAGSISTSTGDGEIEVLSARQAQYFKRIGWGSFRVNPDDVANYPLIQVGHIAVAFIWDNIASAFMKVAAFTIQEVRIVVQDEVPVLEVAGPGLEGELANNTVFMPIGAAEIVTSSIDINYGAGQEAVWVADSTGMEEGDDVYIRAADHSDDKYQPHRRILYRGIISGPPEVDEYEGKDKVPIEPPTTYGALGFKTALTATDYRTPATDDITQIAEKVTGWSANVEGGGDGTTNGTSHPATGASSFELLNAAADITGEWWRPTLSSGRACPAREIDWRASSDSSGVTLVMPTQALAASRVIDTDYGIIEDFIREYDDQRVSVLYPTGGGSGDEAVTLLDVPSDEDPIAGFTMNLYWDLGIGSLTRTATATALSPVIRAKTVSFPNIAPEGVGDDAREQAAIQLLRASEEYLEAHNEAYRFYRVTCVCHKELQLGQTVAFEWSDDQLDLDITPLYIIEINSQVAQDGVFRYGLVLSETLIPRIKGPALLVEMMRNSEGTLRGSSSPAIGISSPVSRGNTELLLSLTDSDPEGALDVEGVSLTFTAYSDASAGSKVVATDANGRSKLNALGLGTTIPDTAGHLWLTGDIKFDGEQTINTVGASTLWLSPGDDLNLNPTGDIVGKQNLLFDGHKTIGTTGANHLTIAPGANLYVSPATNWMSLNGVIVTQASATNKQISTATETLSFVAGDELTFTASGDVQFYGSGNQVFNPSGNIRFYRVLKFYSNPRIDSTTSLRLNPDDFLYFTPATYLEMKPGNGVVQLDTALIKAENYSGGFLGTGWQIEYDGDAEFRTIRADELHVTLFTMEHAVATGRSLWITPGASKLTRDFTVPSAIAGTATMYVEDIPGASGVQVFPTNSWVMLRYFEHDAVTGHFDLFNVWGQVSNFTNLSSSSEQSYTFTLRAGIDYETDADSSVPRSKVLKIGAPVIGFGASGDGFISLTAADHESDDNTPNIRVMTWATNPYTSGNRSLHALFGNLKAATGVEEYGLWAGEGVADDDAYLVMSDQGVLLNNMPQTFEVGGDPVIKIDPAVGTNTPSIAVGVPGGTIPTGPQGGGEGFWVGRFASDDSVRMRIGGYGADGKPALVWDGTTLDLRVGTDTVIELSSSGGAEFTGTVEVTDGELVAGSTTVDSTGISLVVGTTSESQYGIDWYDNSANLIGYARGRYQASPAVKTMDVRAQGTSSAASALALSATTSSAASAYWRTVTLYAMGNPLTTEEATLTLGAHGSSQSYINAEAYTIEMTATAGVDVTGKLGVSTGLIVGGTTAYTAPQGMIVLVDPGTPAATTPPAGAAYLFMDDGDLKFRKSNGTTYTVTIT